MPAYEYRCLDCKRRFEILMTYTEYNQREVKCSHCGSLNIQRKIGRIRFARSDDSRMESLANPENLAGLEDDPRALGRMMRQMSAESGEEMGGEFDEVVGRLEAGQSPEDIEKEFPELGMDEGGSGGMGGMGDMGGMGGLSDDLDDL